MFEATSAVGKDVRSRKVAGSGIPTPRAGWNVGRRERRGTASTAMILAPTRPPTISTTTAWRSLGFCASNYDAGPASFAHAARTRTRTKASTNVPQKATRRRVVYAVTQHTTCCMNVQNLHRPPPPTRPAPGVRDAQLDGRGHAIEKRRALGRPGIPRSGSIAAVAANVARMPDLRWPRASHIASGGTRYRAKTIADG